MTMESRIASAVEKLGGHVPELTVRGVGSITHENVGPLVEALEEHGAKVSRISLEVDRIEDGVLCKILAPLKGNGLIDYVHMTSFPPGPKDIEALAAFVQSDIPLETLELTSMGLGDDRLMPIATALAHQTKLQNLDISQNPHSGAVMDALFPTIAQMKDLASFHFNHTDMPLKKWDELDEALNTNPHPCMVLCSAPLTSDLAEKQSSDLTRFLREMPRNLAGYADYSIENLQRIERCMPALKTIAMGNLDLYDYIQNYKAHLSFAPRLPTDRAVSLEDLIATDADSVTPLHNPLLFREQPELLDNLLTRGELNAETLKRQTPQGFSVLDHLAAFAPPHETIATLEEHGISIMTPGLWFDGDGKTTHAFTLLGKQEDGMAALFNYEHWHDLPVREIKTLLNGFDDATRDAIPNRHALLATRTQPANRGVGA